MKRATLIVNPGAPHQVISGGALAVGLARHGIETTLTSETRPRLDRCDMVVRWGVRDRGLIASARGCGCEVAILELGYIDRTEWFSLSLGGGLNGRARFAPPGDHGERFAACFGHRLRPWLADPGRDGHALIAGQVPGDNSLRGLDADWHYREAARSARALGLQPVFRPHPVGSGRAPDGVRVLDGELADAILGAAVVITINSNVGVDAMLAGVPVVALDRGSMVWGVAAPEVEVQAEPDRESWAAALAWKQYTAAELESGLAWDHLKGA